jgi:sec-independent protein translocase protein TatA
MLGKFEELVVILVIVLVLFGGKKLPQLARGIGESVREVRKGFAGEVDEPKAATATATTKAKPKV